MCAVNSYERVVCGDEDGYQTSWMSLHSHVQNAIWHVHIHNPQLQEAEELEKSVRVNCGDAVWDEGELKMRSQPESAIAGVERAVKV